MKNVLLKIEYDGTSYHGWQKQTNTETIEQSIQSVLGIIFQSEITLRACSRTDAGVHAKGQLATISIPDDFPLQRLFSSVNSLLPPDISIVDIVEVGSDFLIKNENTGKRYIYRVNNSSVRMAIGRNYYWWVKRKFDLAPMQLAASNLVGTHHYSAFRGKGCTQKDLSKTITIADIEESYNSGYRHLKFTIEGSGFLKNMIRIIVGTLVEVGRGKINPGSVQNALKTGLRTDAGLTAPAQGLMLDRIYLKNNPFDDCG